MKYGLAPLKIQNRHQEDVQSQPLSTKSVESGPERIISWRRKASDSPQLCSQKFRSAATGQYDGMKNSHPPRPCNSFLSWRDPKKGPPTPMHRPKSPMTLETLIETDKLRERRSRSSSFASRSVSGRSTPLLSPMLARTPRMNSKGEIIFETKPWRRSRAGTPISEDKFSFPGSAPSPLKLPKGASPIVERPADTRSILKSNRKVEKKRVPEEDLQPEQLQQPKPVAKAEALNNESSFTSYFLLCATLILCFFSGMFIMYRWMTAQDQHTGLIATSSVVSQLEEVATRSFDLAAPSPIRTLVHGGGGL